VYTNPLGADDDDYEMVSFFNRNLRLAHIYGLYGCPKEDGSQAAPDFDIRAHMPPITSLSAVQAPLLQRVPVTCNTPPPPPPTHTPLRPSFIIITL
jgi:hypothetical protein